MEGAGWVWVLQGPALLFSHDWRTKKK